MQTADLASNFFTLFALPVSFDVDLDLLQSRYRELQRAVHPDRYATASDAERRLSVQMAARINEGLQVLKDPLARARYLLELRGVALNDAETALDHEFLLEQMELRERLDAIRDGEDPATRLARLRQDIRARNQELTAQMAAGLRQDDRPSLGRAREAMRKLQFFRRLEQELDELDEELAGF
jgi:molecular chaperone HscB